MMKMTKKIAAMVMTGALVAAMSVPAFAGVASYDIGSLNAKNAYSYAAAKYANAIHEAAVDPAAPVVVAATDGTQIVYANYSEYAAAMANLAREAFAAQGIDNAAALGYGVN